MARIMRIRYVTIEEVDAVLTVTFAEGPGEQGFLLHVMRAVPDEEGSFDMELENYELANAAHDVVEGGVAYWSLAGNALRLSLTADAAAELRVAQDLSFELDVPSRTLRELDAALTTALAPVGEV